MSAAVTDENGAADCATILSSLVPESFRYEMPAEWEEHSACLILFPHNPNTFRVDKASKEIAHLAIEIATTGQEPVYLLCNDTKSAKQASALVASLSVDSNVPVFTVICPSTDTWARDTGPTFVFRKKLSQTENPQPELVGLDWDFNAYGGPEEGCYWPCHDDRKIASVVCSDTTMATSLGQTNSNLLANSLSITTSLHVPIILEGGSFHTDGEGTLLTTKECLLNSNRNPHLSQDEIESILSQSLGIQKVLWLPYGLDADEDTNGHVDNFCCFVKPGHVVLAWTDVDAKTDDNSPNNYQRCRQAEAYLQSTFDAKGRPLQITKLVLPDAQLRYTAEESESIGDDCIREPGEVMAASYINYYVANKAVLVPQFALDDKENIDLVNKDKLALETLRPLYPDRTVVGIPSKEILLGGGNIHCQTQQVPSLK